jgi:hypothetical protein
MTPGEIARSLRRIETKLEEVTGDHEKRLRAIERWMYGAAGAGGLGALTGLMALFGGH